MQIFTKKCSEIEKPKRENLGRRRVNRETKISSDGEGIGHASEASQRLLPHPAGVASHRHFKARTLAFFPDSNWNWSVSCLDGSLKFFEISICQFRRVESSTDLVRLLRIICFWDYDVNVLSFNSLSYQVIPVKRLYFKYVHCVPRWF